MRSGFAKDEALEIAKIIEKAGAAAIALHARTQQQKYRGKADWNLIKKVKAELAIPVIGNGDITTPEQAKRYLDEGYCDYVMIGRAAISNPEIFRQCLDYERKGSYEKTTRDTKIALMKRYHALWKKHKLQFSVLKEHLTWMATGYEGAAKERAKIQEAKDEKASLGTREA
jgi:tRNA-dihydrouridine synthase B